MKRLLILLALWPAFIFAQSSTKIVGPNGSGGTETAKVTNNNGEQVDVTRVQGANTTTSGAISTACAGGTGCAATSYVTVALLGKSTAGAQVTATSSPSGITLVCDESLDGGTTWSQVAGGNCAFDNATTWAKTTSITSFTVGDTYNLMLSGGATNVRIRANALTSGTVTLSVTATDAVDPSVAFAGPLNAAPPLTGTTDAGVATADGAPSAASAGNLTSLNMDLQRRLRVNIAHPNPFQCTASAQSATGNCTTSASGASLFYYITSITMSTSVAQTLQVVSSTTSGCGSGTTNLTAAHYLPANGGFAQHYITPIKAGAANSYLCCARGTGASFSCDIQGYIAP